MRAWSAQPRRACHPRLSAQVAATILGARPDERCRECSRREASLLSRLRSPERRGARYIQEWYLWKLCWFQQVWPKVDKILRVSSEIDIFTAISLHTIARARQNVDGSDTPSSTLTVNRGGGTMTFPRRFCRAT